MKLVVYIHLMMQCISEILLRGAYVFHKIFDTLNRATHAYFS